MEKYHNENTFPKESIHLFLQPDLFTQKAYFYLSEIAYLETEKDYIANLSNRDAYLIFLVSSGKGTLTYLDQTYTIKEGDLIFLNCQNNYSLEVTTPNGWIIIFFYFNGKQAEGIYDIVFKTRKTPVFTLKNTSTILMLFWQIITLHKEKNPQADVITSLNITKILTELILYNQTIDSSAFYPSCVHCVFHYVKHNYHQKITLDKLAAISAVSKFHLSREFRKYTGETISEYIITTRINQAKILLRHSDKSIKEISAEVGFSLPSHFTKVFHEREKMTPGVYRSQWIR